jgi:NADH-quinone oxidoreductase subunit H
VDEWIVQAGRNIHALLSELPVPQGVANLAYYAIIVTVIILVVQVVMLYLTLLERKLVGRIQDRIGPNRVGKFGLLQPLADMVKILTKEDITPRDAHRWVFNLGAILVVPPAILVFAVIPWGRGLIASDLSVGFLYFIAVASTVVIAIFMAGWGSRNKYAVLGAMRAVAQIVSYEIPQVLSAVGVLLLANSLSMQRIVEAQGVPLDLSKPVWPGVWFIALQPIGFMIFLLATTAEIERTPFDIPEAESEIVAGYHIEYSGLKFGMFYLSLYFALFAAAALAATLFLGGWQPLPPFHLIPGLKLIPGWAWFGAKSFAVLFVLIWLRGTLPRLRVDQLMGFAWKALVPLSLVNLLVTGAVVKLAQGYAQSPQPGVFVQSPWVPFAAFGLANALMLGATLLTARALIGRSRPVGPLWQEAVTA